MWYNVEAMAKKIIQVPLDAVLLETLDRLSRKQRQSRSELIRQACRRYIETIEREELDRLYEDGYRRLPETTGIAKAQESLAREVLEEERW